tara:strand:+ start:1369 stop:1575 length:207 start_codon:yes stop_codon:yes gene_type:complete
MKKSYNKTEKYLKIINQIEKARTSNNINWMNVLRIAIKNNPKETIKILKKINKKDRVISRFLNKLSSN